LLDQKMPEATLLTYILFNKLYINMTAIAQLVSNQINASINLRSVRHMYRLFTSSSQETGVNRDPNS